jgi:hypothetical protein
VRVINHFYHGDIDPSDEPTEPTPVESGFHGEAFPTHTASQEDQLTAEEEMIILLMRPLIPGLFLGSIFAYTWETQGIVLASKLTRYTACGEMVALVEKARNMCRGIYQSGPWLRLSLPGTRDVQSWAPAVLPNNPQMSALFSQIQELLKFTNQTERMVYSETRYTIFYALQGPL